MRFIGSSTRSRSAPSTTSRCAIGLKVKIPRPSDMNLEIKIALINYLAEKHRKQVAQKTEYMRKWRAKNPDKNRSTRVAYRDKNRERSAFNMRMWRSKNQERDKASRTAYRKKNKERIAENNKNSLLRRRIELRGVAVKIKQSKPITPEIEKRRKNGRDYWRKRTASDIGFRITNSLRRSLHYFVHTKGMSVFELVGCNPQELRTHLESQFLPGMNWSNYGRNGWHIDHKIPASKFILTNPEHQKRCYHYTNLQPLWAADNLRKSNKILPEFAASFPLANVAAKN